MWKNGSGRLLRRIYYTLVTLPCLVSLWELNYWNMLGFKF